MAFLDQLTPKLKILCVPGTTIQYHFHLHPQVKYVSQIIQHDPRAKYH